MLLKLTDACLLALSTSSVSFVIGSAWYSVWCCSVGEVPSWYRVLPLPTQISFRMSFTFLFQFNRRNVGHDISVVSVWDQGITGRNVNVCVIDDGESSW